MPKNNLLRDLIDRRRKLIIGLNSGTSADGIDAAVIQVVGSGLQSKIKFIAGKTYKFNSATKENILRCSAAGFNDADAWLKLDIELADKFAVAARKVIRLAGLKVSDIKLIGSHGQTVRHLPLSGKYSVTHQLADPARIAVKTGITTVGDFRISDVAAGGQGAPLTPMANAILFGKGPRAVGVLNIGGIANISWILLNRNKAEIFGCDTGPGNMLLDYLARKLFKREFDASGRLAAKGNCHDGLIKRFLRDPFFKIKGPKSTGREKFGSQFGEKFIQAGQACGLKYHDILATATKFIAETIIGCFQINRLNFDELILAGGGSHNHHLVGLLKSALPATRFSVSGDYGYPVDYLEAISFALMANEAICSNRYYLKSVTGSPRVVVLGKICQG